MAWQALRFWRLRPRAMAFLALATLGTLGSLALGSAGLVGLIAGSPGERARRQLASPGVPASLMAANISSAYTQAFCANKGSYLLQGQNWPDAPICQLAPAPVSTVRERVPSEPCMPAPWSLANTDVKRASFHERSAVVTCRPHRACCGGISAP